MGKNFKVLSQRLVSQPEADNARSWMVLLEAVTSINWAETVVRGGIFINIRTPNVILTLNA